MVLLCQCNPLYDAHYLIIAVGNIFHDILAERVFPFPSLQTGKFLCVEAYAPLAHYTAIQPLLSSVVSASCLNKATRRSNA